ncbi:MAG: hypothetical protein R6U85_07610 [Salinivirgaceae bacterium]
MGRTILRLLILTIVFSLTGCAVRYKRISPTILDYDSHNLKNGISIAYKFDVLKIRGNQRYARKARKKNVKLIAVKITNNTDSIINIGKQAAFFSGENLVQPMEPLDTKETIKQSGAVYLPYFLLSFLRLYTSDGNSVKSYPIGLAIGPALAVGNMSIAGSANKKLFNELNDFNILRRDIKQGETVYGIIGVRSMPYGEFSLKLIK